MATLSRFIVLTILLVFLQPVLAFGQWLEMNPEFKTAPYANVENYGSIQLAGHKFPVTRQKALGLKLEDAVAYRYSVHIGQISKSVFAQLKANFKTDHALAFDTLRSYDLTDFMSHFVQATEGKQFLALPASDPELTQWVSQQDDVDPYSDQVSMNTNCWHTTIEFLKATSPYLDIYYVPMAKAASLFNDPYYFRDIKASDLKFGDVLFVGVENFKTGTIEAHHAAIYIGDGYFFEKSGSGSQYLYRFVPLSEISKLYSDITYKRYTGLELPAPELFMLENDEYDSFADLRPFLQTNLSVEISFGQGLIGYAFSARTRMNYILDENSNLKLMK